MSGELFHKEGSERKSASKMRQSFFLMSLRYIFAYFIFQEKEIVPISRDQPRGSNHKSKGERCSLWSEY